MTDIVERLRAFRDYDTARGTDLTVADDAADEIERLRQLMNDVGSTLAMVVATILP